MSQFSLLSEAFNAQIDTKGDPLAERDFTIECTICRETLPIPQCLVARGEETVYSHSKCMNPVLIVEPPVQDHAIWSNDGYRFPKFVLRMRGDLTMLKYNMPGKIRGTANAFEKREKPH